MYYDNKKLALSIFWILLGLAMLILSTAGVIDESTFWGMGTAFVALGAAQCYRNYKYRNDPEYREKIDIEVGDERNQLIRLKAWSWTGYAFVIAAAIGSLIAYFMGQTVVQQTLMYSICFAVFVYWIMTIILNKKM